MLRCEVSDFFLFNDRRNAFSPRRPFPKQILKFVPWNSRSRGGSVFVHFSQLALVPRRTHDEATAHIIEVLDR
jgi:hypothetical protein